ncbi:MAG: hypothetical protein RSC01_09635, partial [Oscillospiraceae bacterium]
MQIKSKIWHRVLGMILAISISITLAPVGVFAQNTTEMQEGTEQTIIDTSVSVIKYNSKFTVEANGLIRV